MIAARKALKFVEGIDQNEFEKDEIIQNAVMRPLEIIGEASAKLSKVFRRAHGDVPWGEMAGMRNRLMHEYFRVDYDIVWDTIQRDLLKLIEQLEPLIPKEDQI